MYNAYCQTYKTVNTRNMSGLLLCCKKKPKRKAWETKLHERMLIIGLWLDCISWYLIGCNTKHSWNILSVRFCWFDSNEAFMTLLGVIKQILFILMEQNKVKNNNIVDMFD